MAWYEAHQTMARHPKTLKLARLIKQDRRYAVGLLHDLFSWALDVAGKYGELPGLEAEDIAVALDVPGKKGLAIVTALMESGFLERDDHGTYSIHDWYDYAGKLMERRESDKQRQADNRRKRAEKSTENPRDVRVTSNGNPYATVPYSTVPNQVSISFPGNNNNSGNNNSHTLRAPAREESPDDGGFSLFWDAYPRKTGDISRAATEYLIALDEGAKLEDMLAALEWQRTQDAWTEQGGRFIPAPEKWLHNRGWTEKPRERRQSDDRNAPGVAQSGTERDYSGLIHYD